jgi:hypothetical protein
LLFQARRLIGLILLVSLSFNPISFHCKRADLAMRWVSLRKQQASGSIRQWQSSQSRYVSGLAFYLRRIEPPFRASAAVDFTLPSSTAELRYGRIRAGTLNRGFEPPPDPSQQALPHIHIRPEVLCQVWSEWNQDPRKAVDPLTLTP